MNVYISRRIYIYAIRANKLAQQITVRHLRKTEEYAFLMNAECTTIILLHIILMTDKLLSLTTALDRSVR